MAGLKLIASPGTRASYSQEGFNLADLIVEKVTGLTYERAVASLLFEPLGPMTLTVATDRAGLTLEVGIKPEIRAAADTELPADYNPFDFGLLPGDADEDYPPSFLDRVEDAVPPGPQALTVSQSVAPPMGSVVVASVAPYPEDMSEMPISEASGHLDEVADESAATGEVIYLTRDGRRLAAIVPVEVAAEIEAAEDAADIAAAEAAMAEPGEDVPAEAVWAKLGIADDE